jgi:hypothetical protein
VVDPPRVEVVFVEEVTERPVTDVVQQPRDAHGLHHQSKGGRVLAAGAERRVEVVRPFARQVHGAESVLEARVLRGGEYPPGALQLVNATQALQPRAVQQVLLGGFPRHPALPALRDAKVSIDGVA